MSASDGGLPVTLGSMPCAQIRGSAERINGCAAVKLPVEGWGVSCFVWWCGPCCCCWRVRILVV